MIKLNGGDITLKIHLNKERSTMTTKYHKTIFLPGLHGQFKLWRQEITKYCNRAEQVIQFGNIIGCNEYAKDKEIRGPNEAILKYILLYRSTEDNWLQLVGPNEIAALNLPEEWTNKTSRQLLRNGWLSSEPNMMVAGVHEGRLVTHGGLTYGEWISIGSPSTPESASERLNEKYRGTLYQGSCYALGGAPNYSANPIWCDPVLELYPSWITAPIEMPFGQAHAGRNLNSEMGRTVVNEKYSVYKNIESLNYRKYGSIVKINGQQIIGVDMPLDAPIMTSIPRPYSIYVEKRAQN